MKHSIRNFLYIGLILLILCGFIPAANTKAATSEDSSKLDAFNLMVAAHTILGFDVDETASTEHSGLKLAAYVLAETVPPNSLELRLQQVKALCENLRQSIQANYSGTQLCEKMAITNQVCAIETSTVESALTRVKRGRGIQTFFRRGLRRLDPGRINFLKFFRFVKHEVLPDSAHQIVTSILSGGNVVVRRVIRQVFVNKVRQIIRADLSTDLLYSGVQTRTIQEISLPAPQAIDLSQLKISKAIDMEAIKKQCQEEEQGMAASPEEQVPIQNNNSDMIEKYLDQNEIDFYCTMPTRYYGTNFVDSGAPETFDMKLAFNLKTGNVTYDYSYSAIFNDGMYNENSHTGEGKGEYNGDGWFSGSETFTSVFYKYILNIQTGEQISSGEKEYIQTYEFLGAVFEDMSQGVFCRGLGGYSKEQIQSVGKEGLFTWNTSICRPCMVEIH